MQCLGKNPRIDYHHRGVFAGHACKLQEIAKGKGQGLVYALFSLRKILDFATVALSFVCGKYYSIID